MKDPVNIMCLYWEGEFRDRDFTPNDVVRLRQSVEKHIDRPFTFYCLTNNMRADIPAEKIELLHNWPGWWSKMELHRPDLPKGRTLYLDLDSHVVSSLAPILDYEGDLVMFPSAVSSRVLRGVVRRYQAATMLFDSGCRVMTTLWERFKADPQRYIDHYRSDQDVMGDFMAYQPTFPQHWMIKLRRCHNKPAPPKEVIIITGQPGDGSWRSNAGIKWLESAARGN